MQSRLIRLIRVVFSYGAMLSMSHKYDSVNERTQEISENAHKFIRQLANNCFTSTADMNE